MLRGIGFSIAALAMDIWRARVWDLARKIADASFVTVCNRAGHARLAALGAGEKLKLIHHGVARSLLVSAAPRPTRDGRDAATPVRFISVARAVEKKGLRRLLDALALLPRDLTFRLDHFGGGDLMAELKAKTQALELQDCVTWHGARPHREVVAALDEADVFVLPAVIGSDGDRDGIPNAVMEAQARGLCVVASRVGGIDEVVRDGVSGCLVEAGDVAELARALTVVARDPALRWRLGEGALAQVARDCDAEASYDAVAALLRERI
jgi:glycosyltransferase involved in cell wall biosynthesis